MKYIFALAILSIFSVSLTSCTSPANTTQSGSESQTGEIDMSKSVKVKIENTHQLAGKTLNFEVELMKLTKANSGSTVETVEAGDSVEVHYTGKENDTGTMFDSSRGKDPLPFTVGAGMMIPGFDAGMMGMKLGETKTLIIEPKDAYGEKEIFQTLPMAQFSELIKAGIKIEAGEKIPVQGANLEILEVIDTPTVPAE